MPIKVYNRIFGELRGRVIESDGSSDFFDVCGPRVLYIKLRTSTGSAFHSAPIPHVTNTAGYSMTISIPSPLHSLHPPACGSPLPTAQGAVKPPFLHLFEIHRWPHSSCPDPAPAIENAPQETGDIEDLATGPGLRLWSPSIPPPIHRESATDVFFCIQECLSRWRGSIFLSNP